jgi:hypothetical protein
MVLQIRTMRIPIYCTLAAFFSFCNIGLGQAFEPLAPDDILVVWNFNDSNTEDHAISLNHGTRIDFVGDATFSPDRTGHSGKAGDRALNLGTDGSADNPTHAVVVNDNPNGAAFVDKLNASNEDDTISVAFWQRWQDGQVANSASVWFTSPSAGSGDRGFQAHAPWGNGQVYFDTSGCCATPGNRLNGPGTIEDWGEWHHIALVKEGGAKQVWMNGELTLEQTADAAPLLLDWTGLFLGQAAREPQFAFHGLLDDVAVFDVALTENQIKALSQGTPPFELALAGDQWPPRISQNSPADGTEFYAVDGGLRFTVTTESPNTISTGDIKLTLNGNDVSNSLTFSGNPQERTAVYNVPFTANETYTARVTATDSEGRVSSFDWSFNTFDPLEARADVRFDLTSMATANQSPSSGDNSTAGLAIDGRSNTYTATSNTPGAWWEAELNYPALINRLEITAPSSPSLASTMEGVRLRIHDLRDRILFEKSIPSIAPGSVWKLDIPGGLHGRIIRLELDEGQRNGAGGYQIALAELRLFGDPTPATGSIRLKDIAVASQSGGASAADRAIDGDFRTYSESNDVEGSFWLLSLDRLRPIHRIELVNRRGAQSRRMSGLQLEILDENSVPVATSQVTDPGSEGVWSYTAPAGTQGRFVRVGLPENQRNGAGDYIISLAEVLLFTSENLALDAEAYMMRFNEGLPPTANGNDGKYNTHTETTNRAVGSFWETDLGEEKALYQVRVVAADGFQRRLTHTTVRVYDGDHNSVFSQHLGGREEIFDVILPGPVAARYVRVGFENKERSDPPGVSWYLGLKELQAFGLPLDEVGLIGFGATVKNIKQGSTSKLVWNERDLRAIQLYPLSQSLGSMTESNGRGELEVTPSESTEYALVGSSHDGHHVKYDTVYVDGKLLPPSINEFVANNQISMQDGRGKSPDWIEIRNPNNEPLSLTGYGLSDDPAQPMKWVFPEDVAVAPHGSLVVFASDRNDPRDSEGWLHANFSLDASGESLQLTHPDGVTIADKLESYPPQRVDLAYGKSMTGQWTFMEPSPNEANLGQQYEGWLAPLTFSQQRGIHENPFTLTIENLNTESEVLISLDGTAPNEAYTAPIRISGNATVRADVRRAGYKSPRTQTHTYVYVEDTLSASNMSRTITGNSRYRNRLRKGMTDLPIVSIAVPELPDDWDEREASVEFFLPGENPLQVNAGVKRFGGAWTEFAKKNYRLKFRPEYGARKLELPLFEGFDHGILAVDQFDELDLRAGGHDMNSRGFYMSARFSEDTMLEMGSLNPHGRFIHLFFNGTYWGQYHARERLTDAFLADYLGGKTEDYTNVRGNDNAGSGFVPGTPDPVNRKPWETVRSLSGNYEEIKEWVDVEHLIDFMLMWTFGNAESEYRAAGPIHPGSGFKFWLGDADGHIRTPGDRTGNSGPGGLFGALVSERHPDFMTLLADRAHMHLFNGGAMTPERNVKRLEERMQEIEDSLVVESARWGYRSVDSWENAAENAINSLFPGQTNTLISRLRGRGLYPSISPPVLSQHGGTIDPETPIEVEAGAGEVFYTLDGSDPRLPGGAVSPTAISLGHGGGGGGASLTGRSESWRYLDIGQAPANGWQLNDFNHNDWAEGQAPLGYGDAGMNTTLDFGDASNNKHISYYFRRSFRVRDKSEIKKLTLKLIRDDGAVVYLNGTEIARDNLPAGEISYDTRALSAAGGGEESAERDFDIPLELLRAGNNVLAAEVHQTSPTSSDLRFDAWLEASGNEVSLSLALQGESLIKMRSFDGRNWSALTEAQFLTDEPQPPVPGDLLFSEIHYNPQGSDDFEFIEILNRSSQTKDLSNLRIDGGIEFLFPQGSKLEPGELLVVVENQGAFADRYQEPGSTYYAPNITVVGEWSGRLDDAGERIDLIDSNATLITSIEYDNSGSWPRRPDGLGSSLEVRDPFFEAEDISAFNVMINRSASWQASSLFHGSPGRIDLGRPSVVINEAIAHSNLGVDWIELHNTGQEAIPLKDFYLSDQFENPFRFALTENNILPAEGYLVFHEVELGFALSELGSTIVLTIAKDGEIIRFADSVQIPATDQEAIYGRYTRTDGITDFTRLENETAGEQNASPAIGSVVISEVMYHPTINGLEYIELTNISSETVSLFDELRLQNVWKLSGGIDLDFPLGTTIKPNEVILISGTEPEVFRSQLSLDASLQIIGPWSGALNNAGELVRLRKPGNPELDGTIPLYIVDQVRYEPTAPWPIEADGLGSSLERAPLATYGNDPYMWIASTDEGTPGILPGSPDNQAPVLPELNQISWTLMVPLSLHITANDPDLPMQPLTYEAKGLPTGLAIDENTGIISGIPTEAGTFGIRITVSDNQSPALTDEMNFDLTIAPAPTLNFTGIGQDGTAQFSFEALDNTQYEIQFTDDLIDQNWSTVETLEVNQGGLMNLSIPINPQINQRFYRLIKSQ